MAESKKPEDLFDIKRERNSMDDFEHLGHDSSPLQDMLGLKQGEEVTPPAKEINITGMSPADFISNAKSYENMHSNLLDDFADDFRGQGEGPDKLDSFLQDPVFNPSSGHDIGHGKESSFNLLEAERISEPVKKSVDQFLDLDDFKEPQKEFKADAFGDIKEPHPSNPVTEIHHIEPIKPLIPEKVETPPLPQKKEPEVEKKPEPEKPKKIEEKKPVQAPAKIAPPDAAAIFCKMGLDAWFNPEKLDPKVESLIYWRDPKKSGPFFGGVLVVLLALTYFSLISVVAYLSLAGLSFTLAFRIYKNIVQAVQKTGDGHPFKEFLEMDVSLPQEKMKEITEVGIAHINAAIFELRRLFLVEDLVDSIKFGVLLWTLTYIGAWFNGMTLIILAWVALFTLPKLYEANKTQIDANLEIVTTKLADIASKIKAAIPMGKKAEEKKEQ